MTEDLKPKPAFDQLLVYSGVAILACLLAAPPGLFALPVSIFALVLAILRRSFKPVPGKRFIAPGLWWGALYALFGIYSAVYFWVSPESDVERAISQVLSLIFMVQVVVPGIIVTVLGVIRTRRVNAEMFAPSTEDVDK
ncbi:MAG: hypothetical protein ACKOOE_03500 [Micrococcales bacterium]